ncbi:MAG: D-2-hydroxyacid dehydrogenase [Acidobacteria bacterium]|nr:D-2-hydroxyacid dehydrogenase [Acidobacteriota bacterium]
MANTARRLAMDRKTRTLLISSEDGPALARLIRAARLPGLRILRAASAGRFRVLLPRAHIVLGEPHRIVSHLTHASALEWVQSTWAGVERLVEPCRRMRLALTGVKEVFGPLISEYVMAYVLAIERGLFDMRARQIRRQWIDRPYRPLRGLEIGILGLGSIGVEVAATARCFGIRVRGLRRSGRPVRGVTVFSPGRMTEFLRNLDYLVATLPMTPQTESFFDRRFFSRMDPRTVFINVGRGAQVVEEDLAAALRRHRLRGAVLDVFRKEPLPRTSPLWRLPGVYITPHNAAELFPEQIAPIFIENYRRYRAGRRLLHRINLRKGY